MSGRKNVDQILQLAFKKRWIDEEIPPAPGMDWFRERLEVRDVPTPPTPPEPEGQPWWQKVRELLRGQKPTPFQPATATLYKPAPKGETAPGRTMLGTIPAGVVREDREEKAGVEVTLQPAVNDEGHLVLGVRVREIAGILESGEILELILLAAPEGKPVGQPLKLCVGAEEILDIELPEDLRKAWQGIKDWDWSELPFQFALCPCNETVEGLKGEAAGAQSKGKDDRLEEHNLHHHPMVTWAIPPREFGR